jgi:uncharacterized membrane protein HdeD (DUF308 family)
VFKLNKTNTYGVLGLLLVVLAIITGFVAIITESVEYALIYLAVIAICVLGVLYSYCAKCKNTACGHIYPGKMVKYLPKRKQTNYSNIDKTIFVICMFLVFFFPQPWLIRNFLLLTVFWALVIIRAIILVKKTCQVCNNDNCPLNPNFSKSQYSNFRDILF